jgi:hypothetical protein
VFLSDAERRDMKRHDFRRSAHQRLRRLSAQDLRAEVVTRMSMMGEEKLRAMVEMARRLG